MAIIIDIIIVAVMAIVIWRSAVHGFVRTVIELVGYILAGLVAMSLSASFADFVYDKYVNPAVVQKVEETMADYNLSGTEKQEEIWESLPPFITTTADLFKADEQIKSSIEDEIDGKSKAVAQSIAEAVKPVSINVVRIVSSTLIFILLIAVVKFVAKHINRLFKVPVLSSLNSVLGGLIGAAKGFIIVFVFALIVKISISAFDSVWIFNEELIDSTYLLRFVYNLSI